MPKVPKDAEPVKDRSLLFALWDNERASLASADGSEYLQGAVERLIEQVEELQGAIEKLTAIIEAKSEAKINLSSVKEKQR